MSESHEKGSQNATAAIEEQALGRLLRRDQGVWSAQDQAELDEWLALSWSHRVMFWRLEAAWTRADRLNAMRQSNSVRLAATAKPLRRIIGGAAAILIIAMIGTFAAYRSAPTEHFYATGIGVQRMVRLDDGSQIELNTDTAIGISTSSNQRIVRVDKGEAYFDIAHSVTRQFMVLAGSGRILDLGTKFLVRRDTDRLQVSLIEGRAQFSVNDQDSRIGSVSLRPGDVAIATPTSFSVTRKSLPLLRAELGWRRGLLIFDNTPLTAVAAEFNRYNHVKLIVADRATENITVGGTFAADDVTAFARVAKGVLGLRVEARGETIVVSR
jgi:transmembrane sensor